MKRTAILAIILALVIIGGCDSEKSRQKASQEIIALERSALDKWAQSNTSGFIDISADEVTWFDFQPGAQPRVDGIAAVRNYLAPLTGQIPQHTYELVNPKVQWYGNTAILTFHWKATMTDGKPLDGCKATSVYNLKEGKWRHVHAHWSPVQAN